MINRFLFLTGALLTMLPLGLAQEPARVESKNMRIEFDRKMHSRVVAKFEDGEHIIGDFTPAQSIQVSGADVKDFVLQSSKSSGKVTDIRGAAPSLGIHVAITIRDDTPRLASFQVENTNTGKTDLHVTGWTNQYYAIASAGSGQPAFWSYQSGSYEKRPDWVLPLKPGFKQENYMGMNQPDYGGGTPGVDVWRRDVGIAVGHLEMAPKLVSLPVTMPDATHATVAVEFKHNFVLKPGETLKTFPTFVAVHKGDYF